MPAPYTDPIVVTDPDGSEAKSLGDDRIREFKRAIKQRLDEDHEFPQDETGDNEVGYHRKVSLTFQGSDPTVAATCWDFYSKKVGGVPELFFKDSAGNIMQCSSGGQWIAGFTNEVRMYRGLVSAIPTGWQLCDGTNGTPDLRGKMIPCTAGASNPGAVSGDDYVMPHTHVQDAHTHTTPDHQHSLKTNGDAPGRSFLETANGSVLSTTAYTTSDGGGTSGSTTPTNQSAGSATAYALAYITRI